MSKDMYEGATIPSLEIINVKDGTKTTLDKVIGESTAVVDHYTTW